MSIKDIFKNTFRFGKENWLWLTALGFLSSFLAVSNEKFFGQIDLNTEFTTIFYVALLKIISSALSIWVFGTVFYGVKSKLQTEAPEWVLAMKKGSKKWLLLVAASILIGLGTLVGILLLVIPGILFILASSVALIALLDEDLTPVKAIKRSWELTKKNYLKILALLFIFTSAEVLLTALLFLLFALFELPVLLELTIIALVAAPLLSLQGVLITFLYFSLKAEKQAVIQD